MKGYWLFLAGTALCGSSLFLGVHWGLIIVFHCIWLRIVLLKKRKLIILSVGIYVIFALYGLWANEQRQVTKISPTQTSFFIQLNEPPHINGNQFKSMAKTNQKENIVLNYKIGTEVEKKRLMENMYSGIICKVEGELQKPESNRNENLFNYRLYLYRQNVHWILKVTSITSCEESSKGFIQWVLRARENGLKRVDNLFSPNTIPYAKALLFGDSSSFSEEIYSLYQRLGIVHLLAISGLHVGVISSGIFYILIRLGCPREMASWILLIILPTYAIITGIHPPVVRAVIMSMLIIGTIRKNSPISSTDALSICFILFLLKDPFIIFHIGFQLSFTVSLCILLASRSLLLRYRSFFTNLMLVSFISQISALPILSFHFFEISLTSIFSNIIYVPLYTFIVLPLFFLTFVSSYIDFTVFHFIENASHIVVSISEGFGSLLDFKYGVLVTGKPGMFFLCIFIVVSQLVLFLLERRRSITYSIFPLFMMILIFKISQFYDPTGEVTFIDVGQGDSILIRLPFHRGTYLIDTGGEVSFPQEEWAVRKKPFTVGKDIILPYLKSKGITKIDKLILTHSDSDHIGAAEELLERLTVHEILLSPNSWEKPMMLKTVQMALSKNISIKVVKAGFKWKNQSGYFRIIFPFDNHYEGNNDSLVLYAEFGGLSWLFTGDLEAKGEKELLENERLKVDVLKIGHHGSKGSSTEVFLQKLNPTYAIISAGKNNRYRHPHKEVLERLTENHIKIFRTDLQGAIQYNFLQNNGTFLTFSP